MKLLLIFTFCTLAAQFAAAQACGIYRIAYVGNIASPNREIVKVYLPTTWFLEGIENEKSDRAFIETTLTKGAFKVEVRSHLSTPFNAIDPLLSFYKKQSDKFKMKVSFVENGSVQETTIDLDWSKVAVTIIKDGKFGTLFRFTLDKVSL